ncbi:hypothetical protein ALC56_15291 [Trachymyrmex septentrionalis]|uniref:CHK kinase-like domain-containing protein n=1 Tax=Trachymyrmex septentrionalis TaxID=34720 RepID=A0A195EQP0_9HYME|nr:PREDICTED: uncharacterized protein LOC108756220 [Trachymyrmex septentrionalis]KYN30595.1 hypothetical protein ALC56_15291 [Trachymyrmex septentrionalis]
MSHENFQKWFDEVMPKIIKNFGLDVDSAQYKLLESTTLIASIVHRIHLQFENKTNRQNEELFIILKKSIPNFCRLNYADLQFQNEILFYQTYIRPDEIYAKCFYVEERPPLDYVIALENVNTRGYYACSCVYNPPMEYTLAAMRELGRFHGKGYVMKQMQPKKFFDIVEQIQETRYTNKFTNNAFKFGSNIMTLRVVEYLRSQDYDAIFCDKMEAYLSNAFDKVMIKTVQPLEPLATLCHGDFTLSNILFKAEDNGQLHSMLIDFALIRYSMPVVDLSTYLYICCTNEMRKSKFPEIMRAYHDAMKDYLSDAGIQDIEKYSYDALLEDFKRGALFGFVLKCFFTPILLGYYSPELLIQDMINLGPLEGTKKQKYIGGDEVSKMLAEALLHMKDLGCLEHVL